MITPLVALLFLADAASASSAPPLAIARVDTRDRVVALTFDACATERQANGFDRDVFEILRREQIPTTVFVSGRWIEFHPAEAAEMAAEPWIELGNHSYSHPHLTTVSLGRVNDEIARTEALIASLGRRSVAFRPPAGDFDGRTIRAAAGLKLPTVLWDVVSGDAGGHVSADAMVKAVSREARPGSIVIFHINGRGPHTKKALPEILRRLRARGLDFVFLSELLRERGRPVPATRELVGGPRRRTPAPTVTGARSAG